MLTDDGSPQGGLHAAIDIGTNSVHLLVARVDDQGRFDVIAQEKEMVRLGSGSGDMSRLADDAIERGIATLRRFRQIAEVYGASVCAVATSAVREADNRDVFIRRARDEAHVEVRVISGIEEARLIHLGVLQAVPVFGRSHLVVDIGGGSTEFVVATTATPDLARSVKLGTIRLTDRFFPGGDIAPGAIEDCRRYLRAFLDPVSRAIRREGFEVAIGSSGTFLNVVAMSEQLEGREPRSLAGAGLTREQLGSVVEAVVSHDTARRRRRLGGLDEKRADIIVGGVLLVEAIFDTCGVQQMAASANALREGVVLDLVQQTHGRSFHHLSDLRRESVLHMVERYHEDPRHIECATDLALELFDGTAELHGFGLAERDLLEAAGLLHNVGLFVSHSAHHKHSYYVIRHSDQLAGFSEREIELIAQIARYHRKSAPKPSHAEFMALESPDQRLVRLLAGMLRVGIALDRTRRRAVKRIECRLGGDDDSSAVHIDVVADPALDSSLELYTAEQRKSLLSEALDRPVVLHLRPWPGTTHPSLRHSHELAATERP